MSKQQDRKDLGEQPIKASANHSLPALLTKQIFSFEGFRTTPVFTKLCVRSKINMPPRIQTPVGGAGAFLRCQRRLRTQRLYATHAISAHETLHGQPTTSKLQYPPTQPPSYKPPEFRKSQLLRQYASLLRSTPLMLLFQHNNLKSTEWVALRRELTKALQMVDESLAAGGHNLDPLHTGIKMQIIQTGIFGAALNIVEFFQPELDNTDDFTHILSRSAHIAASRAKRSHDLGPLLSGPLALVTFPNVSPQHLKAVISTLSPSAPQFPAPTRRANPGWHDLAVQGGLQKLLLLGARVDDQVFDVEGTKWIGGIDGGIEGLRTQLLAMLQGVGAGVTRTLESAGRSVYFTVDGRRTMLEEEAKDQSETTS